jgi:hypothetical protein
MPKSLLWICLSLFLAVVSLSATALGQQTAGEVKALIPDAYRNAQPVKAKDPVAWNDLLKTDAQGRLRAGLTAGSILSLGSNSELKVVEHDAVSQQTSLVMNYGKLRNQVAKITKADGKYEVKTPNAIIGVTGTDFYVSHENDLTTVICYSGTVAVTPLAGAKVVKKDEKSKKADAVIILTGGQMVVIGVESPAAGYVATAAPAALVTASLQDTNVPAVWGTVAKMPTHRMRAIWIGIGTGIGVGVGVGVGVAETGGGGGGTTGTTTPAPTIINFTNQFGTVNLTSAGIVSKGSELQNYNGIAAPPKRSLGSVDFSAGAFTGTNILTGGTFASAGSIFNIISGPANYGQPPKGNIFTGSFTGPVNWTLVSQSGKYTDNFTLSGAISGTYYSAAAAGNAGRGLTASTTQSITGMATENITLYTNQWTQDHEALIRLGKGQLSIPAPVASSVTRLGSAGMRLGLPDARANALAKKSMRRQLFGWSFVF